MEGFQKAYSPLSKQTMESPKMTTENRKSEETMFTIKRQTQAHKRAFTKNSFEVTQSEFKNSIVKSEYEPLSPTSKAKFTLYKSNNTQQGDSETQLTTTITVNDFISPRKVRKILSN
jgi:hypothetical protein